MNFSRGFYCRSGIRWAASETFQLAILVQCEFDRVLSKPSNMISPFWLNCAMGLDCSNRDFIRQVGFFQTRGVAHKLAL